MTRYSTRRAALAGAGMALVLAVTLPGMARAEPESAAITGADGGRIGSVTLVDSPHGVLMRVTVAPGNLAPGAHGMHLHSVGDCSDVGAFKMSKGHINPDGREHGLLNPKGPDNADLPNLVVRHDGSADVELFTDRVRLAGGPAALLDSDGSALVIHANPDDHMTQPIGGAGARVACAEIKG